jgi:aminoglycoside phosphotransferase family enzyme
MNGESARIKWTIFRRLRWPCKPSSYRERTHDVSLIETHISWVFLTDRFAYKLKKPVRFEFVDFCDVEARHKSSQAEVQLNRRLTSNVYLAVVPVVRDQENRFQLGGAGEVVDWVVKMRRLDEADTLLVHIKRGPPLGVLSAGIVSHLAAFYRSAERPVVSGREYHDHLVRHVQRISPFC